MLDTGAGRRQMGTLVRSSARRLTAPPKANVAALFGSGNAIGFLRFALASLVIVHHTRVLGGFGADAVLRATRHQADLGVLAVAGFFALSGLLITRSAFHASLPRFLWHRGLRIFPGYWVCLVVISVVIGPLLWWSTHGGLADYRGASPSPAGYVVHNAALVVRQNGIDRLLADNPYPRVLDGSLWTLKYEFAWYLVVAFLAGVGLLRRSWAVGLVVLLALIGPLFGWRLLSAIPIIGFPFESRFGLPFAVGMLAYVLRDRIPLDDRLAVAAGIMVAATLRLGGFSSLGLIAFGYMVLWAAWRIPWRGFGTRHDLSYGVYIYAFPIQQSLAHFLPGLGYLPFMIGSFALTLPLAWLSYTIVESPALRLKNFTPPSGLRALRARRARVTHAEPGAASPDPGADSP